jgi:hypothetical protein
MLRRLFQNLEQAVGCLAHERRGSEDGEGAFGFDRRTVVGHVNHLPHLAHFDEQLRRVRRNDEHVRVGLDEDARLALVGLAQIVAGFHGLGYALFQVGCFANSNAVGADAAKVRQSVRFRLVKTIEGLCEHERKRVFACPARAGENERMREPAGADAFAEVRDGLRIAEKILKAHVSSLEHPRPAVENQTPGVRIRFTPRVKRNQEAVKEQIE